MSDSLDDPFIYELITRYGGDGYLVFFGILEILSREFDAKSPGKLTVFCKFLTKKLQLSRQKTVKILKFCTEKGRIFAEIDGDKIHLNCPKFREIWDDTTARKVRTKSEVTSDQLRNDSVSSRARILDTDIDADLDKEVLKHTKKDCTELATDETTNPAEILDGNFPLGSGSQVFNYSDAWKPYGRLSKKSNGAVMFPGAFQRVLDIHDQGPKKKAYEYLRNLIITNKWAEVDLIEVEEGIRAYLYYCLLHNRKIQDLLTFFGPKKQTWIDWKGKTIDDVKPPQAVGRHTAGNAAAVMAANEHNQRRMKEGKNG